MSLYEYIGRIKRTFPDWCETGYGWSRETKQMADLIRDMLNEYDFEMSKKKPSDPPQPPEMPECVAKLLAWFKENPVSAMPVQTKLEAVRDHYAQPLKLEVGKVYADEHEGPVKIVWKSPSPNGYRWLGVVVTNGETRWFNDDGKPPCQTPEFKLIREVAKP